MARFYYTCSSSLAVSARRFNQTIQLVSDFSLFYTTFSNISFFPLILFYILSIHRSAIRPSIRYASSPRYLHRSSLIQRLLFYRCIQRPNNRLRIYVSPVSIFSLITIVLLYLISSIALVSTNRFVIVIRF